MRLIIPSARLIAKKLATPTRPNFVYPLANPPRTAVLIHGFRSRGPAVAFPDGFSERVVRFRPHALAGEHWQIASLDRTVIPTITHALVVCARPAQPRLSAAERDRLWDAFGVPVFEQILGSGLELIASECQAHCGLHLVTSDQAPGPVDDSPCACGRTSPRLVDVDSVSYACVARA